MTVVVVFSPHTDDAIFSIGAWLAESADDIVIATPMAGIPEDDAGRQKHQLLRCEHVAACKHVGARAYNGGFLDDVYRAPRRIEVKDWLANVPVDADAVYIPLGIHHPDHLMVSNVLISMINEMRAQVFFYEELPYRIDYPQLADRRHAHIEDTVGRLQLIEHTGDHAIKRLAVECYASQVDPSVRGRVLHPTERIWQLVR